MKIICLLTVFLACIAVTPAQTTAVSLIRAVRERSNRALAAHDITTFGESLTDDFVMVRGSGVFVPSRQAYMDQIAADFKDPKSVRYERIPEKIEISTATALAAEHGHWTATLPSGKNAYTGTCLAMWRLTGTQWKIRSELFVVIACGDEASCAACRK
jgi:ketosteroid isomerase-like protein